MKHIGDYRRKFTIGNNKKEAKEKGLKHYKANEICRNGHESIRHTKDNQCMQCVAERLNEKRRATEQRSRMIDIDHLLGLKRDEKEFLDPWYFEELI